MKNTILVFLTLLFAGHLAYAQTFEFTEGMVTHKDGLRSSIRVYLTPSPKDVKKAWKDYIEKEFDADVDGIGLFTNKDLLTAEQVQIRTISDKELDLYNEVLETPDRTEMNVFAALGYDVYLSKEKHPEAYEGLRTLTFNFVKSFLPNYLEKEIEDQREEVKDLQEDIVDMKKKIEKNKEKIESLQKENVELEQKIVEAEAKLERSTSELDSKREKLEKTKKKISDSSINNQ